MHHVIIGAGPAAVCAAEHIKKLDASSQVTMLAAEVAPPYSRMAIPYMLVGNIDQPGTYLRKDSDHFSNLGITVRHARASSVDTAAKKVKLLGVEEVGYDKLLIASGATATRPPIPGIDLEKVYNCWSLADAHKIIEHADEGSNVVLMGAGFIGCIILESLAARKVNLTVIEMEDRMVSRMTNNTMGNMIKDWCVAKGIRVMTSTKVDAIEQEGNGSLGVKTNTGENINADLVICATGVRSNTAFLEGSGINVDAGIVVDDFMQTSVADIYAAGDVAQGKDFSTGEYYVQAIQPTAVEHGKVAAQSMVKGHLTPHAGNVNMNVLDTAGLISTSFGMWMGVEGGEYSELIDNDNFQYINLQFKGDVLVGASSLGMTQHVGVMRGMIQTGASLGEWKEKLMENPMRISEAYLAGAQSQHVAMNA